MAAHSTFPLNRPTQYSWFESIIDLSALRSAFIEGVGAFGLAANGMCPMRFAETTPQEVGTEPRSADASELKQRNVA